MGRRERNLRQTPRSRIEEIRLARHFRSAEVARRAEIDPSTFHKIETKKMPLARKWQGPIAKVLMVPESFLYAPIGSPIPFAPDGAVVVEVRPYEPEHAPPAIGRRLRAAMRYCGLGPKQLAEAIGATEEHILDWSEGRSRPPLTLMNRLANRAGLTLAWIYFGDNSTLFPNIAEQLQAILDRM